MDLAFMEKGKEEGKLRFCKTNVYSRGVLLGRRRVPERCDLHPEDKIHLPLISDKEENKKTTGRIV